MKKRKKYYEEKKGTATSSTGKALPLFIHVNAGVTNKIIELPASRQVMVCDYDGSLWIMYKPEIAFK